MATPAPIPSSLNAADIRGGLPQRITVGRQILVFAETNSTNDLARHAGNDGVAEGLVIFAESQRAGRGTQGRQWLSPPSLGLLLSVLLRPTTVPVERWPELTFCAALAVAETVESFTGQMARIKWPNDVLICERKVAGILVECHHRQTPGFVVLGIGLNVLQRSDNFDPDIRERATSIAMSLMSPVDLDRQRVAQCLLTRLDHHYLLWPEAFSAIENQCGDRGCDPPHAGKIKGGPLPGTAF